MLHCHPKGVGKQHVLHSVQAQTLKEVCSKEEGRLSQLKPDHGGPSQDQQEGGTASLSGGVGGISSPPYSNTFTPLKIVKKNSPTARIRSVREIPKAISPLRQPDKTSLNMARVENPVKAIYKAHKAIRDGKRRRNQCHF